MAMFDLETLFSVNGFIILVLSKALVGVVWHMLLVMTIAVVTMKREQQQLVGKFSF